jgi:hypothetical protein
MSVNLRRKHKAMERALRKRFGSLPPHFKFKVHSSFQDTFDSIVLPAGYTKPTQSELETQYNSEITEEESRPFREIKGDTRITDDLEVGTANLYVDVSTSRVGIGMTDPSYTLDVNGTANITTVRTGPLSRTSYSAGEVIEELHAVCNKTSLHGRCTIQNVTTNQNSTDSYQTLSGSLITGYTPPEGTKMIVYECTYQMSRKDSHSISNLKIFFRIGSGSWIEVTKARSANSGQQRDNKIIQRWVFEVGAASADNSLGIMTQSRPELSFQIQHRRHNSSHDYILHKTEYWDNTGTDQYSQPMIMIKALA